MFSVRLPADLTEEIDQARGKEPRNAYIKAALQRAVRGTEWTLVASWEELRRTLCGLALEKGLSKAGFEVELEGSGTWDPELIQIIRVRLSQGADGFTERLNHMDGRIRTLELLLQADREAEIADSVSRALLHNLSEVDEKEEEKQE